MVYAVTVGHHCAWSELLHNYVHKQRTCLTEANKRHISLTYSRLFYLVWCQVSDVSS